MGFSNYTNVIVLMVVVSPPALFRRRRRWHPLMGQYRPSRQPGWPYRSPRRTTTPKLWIRRDSARREPHREKWTRYTRLKYTRPNYYKREQCGQGGNVGNHR